MFACKYWGYFPQHAKVLLTGASVPSITTGLISLGEMGNNLGDAVPPSEMYCHKDQPKQTVTNQYQIHGHTLEVVDSSKYLGVTISEDLNWRKHIDDTVNKANKNLGFVRRNLSDCSAPVKSAAYTTIVRPILEYSSTVWDPHHNRDIHNLEQVHAELQDSSTVTIQNEHQDV